MMDRETYKSIHNEVWGYLKTIYQSDNLFRATIDMEEKIRPYLIESLYTDLNEDVENIIGIITDLCQLSEQYYTADNLMKQGSDAKNRFEQDLNELEDAVTMMGYKLKIIVIE